MLGVILSPTTEQTMKTRGVRRTAWQAVTVSENSSIAMAPWNCGSITHHREMKSSLTDQNQK